MKYKPIKIYLDNDKVFRDFLISFILTIVLILLFENLIENKNILEKTILIMGILLFGSGVFLVFFHLIRKTPTIIIDNEKVTIYRLIGDPIHVKFNNIKSISIWNTYYKGFVSNRLIVLELKRPTQKYKKTAFYKLLKFVGFNKLANSQYGIETRLLEISYKKLEAILKDEIKNTT